MKIRAAVLESFGEPLVVQELDLAGPKAGEVLVKVHACGVCHSDVTLVDGAVPGMIPIILGHEAAGVIDAVGDGVVHLAPGDPVVLTPCPPCGTCYWCTRAEFSLCQQSMGIMTSGGSLTR